jgi:hypothetical protein
MYCMSLPSLCTAMTQWQWVVDERWSRWCVC